MVQAIDKEKAAQHLIESRESLKRLQHQSPSIEKRQKIGGTKVIDGSAYSTEGWVSLLKLYITWLN
jgi:hypothetical protein